MKHLLKEYLTFSKRDRNGILLLLGIIVILLILPNLYPLFTPESPPAPPFPDTIVEWQNRISEQQEQAHDARQMAYQKANYKPATNPFESATAPTIEPFPFNPNTLTMEEAQQLGLSKRVASTIQNYRNKGGKFFKKEDLKKIYGLKEADYKRLANYVVIPTATSKKKYQKNNKQSKNKNDVKNSIIPSQLFEFDPNTVDFDGIQQLGLSKKVAKTWVKFRDKGGKFFKPEDLKKVYGLTSDDYEHLADYINIPKSKATKGTKETTVAKTTTTSTLVQLFEFDPNTVDFEGIQQLGLSKKVAKTWVKFRDKGGKFFKPEDLKKVYGLTNDDYEHLVDYINIPKSKTTKGTKETTVAKTTTTSTLVQLFEFDPNTVDFEGIQQLGLSKKVAKTWVNFRDKGGKFFKPEDLKKVYGLTESDYHRLADYIDIAKKTTPISTPPKTAASIEKVTNKEPTKATLPIKLFNFNPNTISFEELQQLGLSKKVAHTWLNFREKGGKFFKKEDVQKIYGLNTTDYQRLAAYINIPTPQSKKRAEHFSKTTTPLPAKEKEVASQPKPTPPTIQAFPFDPNTISLEELKQLGLSKKIVETWGNFRDKGGKFFKKTDVQKIYGLTDALYQQLADHINIQPLPKSSPSYHNNSSIQVDINTADEAEWQKISGIGPAFSKRIVKYRNLLGGFTAKEQLKEVYGLDEDRYNSILPSLTLNNTAIQKVKLNTASFYELKKHPYIEENVAKAIVSLREQHGYFKQLEDIQQSYAIDDALFQKIKPYLTLQ